MQLPGLVVLGGDDRIDGVTQKVTISYFSHTWNCLLLWPGGWGRWDQGWRSKRPLHFHTLPHIRTHLLLCHSGYITFKRSWIALCYPRSQLQSWQIGFISASRSFSCNLVKCLQPFRKNYNTSSKLSLCSFNTIQTVFQDEDKAVFTGDTLFLGGCGRFFEGTVSKPIYFSFCSYMQQNKYFSTCPFLVFLT